MSDFEKELAENAERVRRGEEIDSQSDLLPSQWVELNPVRSPEEDRFAGLLDGLINTGTIDKKEALDILAEWRRKYYE